MWCMTASWTIIAAGTMKRATNTTLHALATKQAKTEVTDELEQYVPGQGELDGFEEDTEAQFTKLCQSFKKNDCERTLKKLSMIEFSDAHVANLATKSAAQCKMFLCAKIMQAYTNACDQQYRELFEKTWLPVFMLGTTQQGVEKLAEVVNSYAISCTDLIDAFNNPTEATEYNEVEHCIPKAVYDVLMARTDKDEFKCLFIWCKFHQCINDDAMSLVIDACQVRSDKLDAKNKSMSNDEPIGLYLSCKRPVYIPVKSETTTFGSIFAVNSEAARIISQKIKAAVTGLTLDPPVVLCNYKKYEGLSHTGAMVHVECSKKTSAVLAVNSIKLCKKPSGQLYAKLFGVYSVSNINCIQEKMSD